MARKPRKIKEAVNAPYQHICGWCGGVAEFVDSAEVYEGVSRGMIYLCRPCDAWAHVHKGTTKANGYMANREVREWQQKAKDAFNPLWKAKYHKGCKTAREDGYAWLAKSLNISPALCHITMMVPDDLKRVVELCTPYLERLGI